MTHPHRRPQACVLGSAEPGSTAYDLAAAAGVRLARLGITVVSGCGSPAARVGAERALTSGLVVSIVPPDERQNSPILPWQTSDELESQLRELGLAETHA